MNATPTTLRCTTPADLLAALPRFAGFTATNSVFFLPLDGKRAHGIMRVDLPDAEQIESLYTVPDPRFLDWAFEILTQLPPVDSVAVVIVTDQTFASSGVHPPLYLLGRTIAALLTLREIGGRPPIVQAPDGFAELHPEDYQRHPLEEITTSPAYSPEAFPTLEEWHAARTDALDPETFAQRYRDARDNH